MSEPKITVIANASLKVEGDVPLFDDQGNRIETTTGKAYFLCRCGGSSRKPFCDGTHRTIGFDGSLAESR
ncbi:MAG: CDGSH iron-sulfur domain-containing protein [Gemmatimonadota bacterium]